MIFTLRQLGALTTCVPAKVISIFWHNPSLVLTFINYKLLKEGFLCFESHNGIVINPFNVTTWKRLYLSVACCCGVLFLSSFMVGVDLSKSMTCLHFHALIYSKYDIVKRFPHTYVTLNNSLGNTIIPSQRLVTMSASLCTQTVLHCLIIPVLNIKSLLPKCLIQSLSLLYILI